MPLDAPARTDRKVYLRHDAATLPVPTDVSQVVWSDKETDNLKLEVAKSGRRVWLWRVRAHTERIGEFKPSDPSRVWSYEAARKRALLWSRGLERGMSPRAAVEQVPEGRTMEELFAAYEKKLTDNTRTRKPNESLANFRAQIRPFRERHGDLPVLELNRAIIMAVIREHHLDSPDRRDWTVASAQQMVGWLKSSFAWGQRNGMVPTAKDGSPFLNPSEKLVADERDLHTPVRRRGEKGHKVDLAEAESLALLKAAEEVRKAWRPRSKRKGTHNPAACLLIEFLLYTGARKNEAAYMHLSDEAGEAATVLGSADPLDTIKRARTAELAEHKTGSSSGETRVIHLGTEARRILALAAGWRKSIGYKGPLVFPSPNGKVCTTINHTLDAICEVARTYGLTRRIVVHSLRAAYANYAIRAGVELSVISKNLGHSDERTTREYYRVIAERAQQAGNDRVDAEFAALRQRMAEDVPLPPTPHLDSNVVPLRPRD